MEKPKIKDKDVEKYVDYLEKRLAGYDSEHTMAKSYLALKHFVESNCKVLQDMQLTEFNMQDKDDKIAERTLKFAKEILSYNEDLESLEKKVSPKTLSEEQKKTGNPLEEALFTKDDSN